MNNEESFIKQQMNRLTAIIAITVIVVLLYGAGCLYALVQGKMTVNEFLMALGPTVGILVGYLARADKT